MFCGLRCHVVLRFSTSTVLLYTVYSGAHLVHILQLHLDSTASCLHSSCLLSHILLHPLTLRPSCLQYHDPPVRSQTSYGCNSWTINSVSLFCVRSSLKLLFWGFVSPSGWYLGTQDSISYPGRLQSQSQRQKQSPPLTGLAPDVSASWVCLCPLPCVDSSVKNSETLCRVPIEPLGTMSTSCLLVHHGRQ